MVVAATLPGRRQGRPWPYEDGSTSDGWGALPRILWRASKARNEPPLFCIDSRHLWKTAAEAEVIRDILGFRKRIDLSPEELARR